MSTRNNIRDAASTLAHIWNTGSNKDRFGVERLILSHPVSMRPVLCALIMVHLERQHSALDVVGAFENLLFEFTGELVETDGPNSPVPGAWS